MPVSGSPGVLERRFQVLTVTMETPVSSLCELGASIRHPSRPDHSDPSLIRSCVVSCHELFSNHRANASSWSIRHVRRIVGSIRCGSQGPRRSAGFHLGVRRSCPPPPPPPAPPRLTAWAAAINKSISTRWITFIRLGDCYPDERESRLMGKLILQ